MVKYKKVTFSIPESEAKRFKLYCENNAINMSAKITMLIQKELQNVYNK